MMQGIEQWDDDACKIAVRDALVYVLSLSSSSSNKTIIRVGVWGSAI